MTNSTVTPKTVGILRKQLASGGNQSKSASVVRSNLRDLYVSLVPTTSGSLEDLEVKQWLDYVAFFIIPILNDRINGVTVLRELDSYLSTRSYFVGNKCGLADAAIFTALKTIVANLNNVDHEQFQNLVRWYSHIQEVQSVNNRDKVNFPLIFTSSAKFEQD